MVGMPGFFAGFLALDDRIGGGAGRGRRGAGGGLLHFYANLKDKNYFKAKVVASVMVDPIRASLVAAMV